MNHPNSENLNCSCHSKAPSKTTGEQSSKLKLSLKTLPSILLSLGIALFPKCPICWAAYMSMFGCVGLAKLPHMWLLPILLLFLGIHFYSLYKKSDTIGFLPLQLSLAGALVMLLGKFCFPQVSWLVFVGVGLIVSASLMLSFSPMRTSKLKSIHNS